MKQKSLWRGIAEHIELFIILFFIILNIFDLLEYLTPTFDYVDKIAGMIALAYLIYLASPAKIILGQTNKKIDLALITSFVLLMFNKVTTAAAISYQALQEKATAIIEISKATAQKTPEFFLPVQNIQQLTSADLTNTFYQNILDSLTITHNKVYFAVTDGLGSQLLVASTPSFSFLNISNFIDGSLWFLFRTVVEHQVLIEKLAFYSGALLLLATAIYAGSREITPHSFLHVLHGDRKRFQKKPLRALVLFFTFCFFFLFLFQLMVEWLGVVIDAPLLFLGILFCMLFMIRYRHFFGPGHLMTKIGETGEAFYQEFIALFHTKYGVALGLSGILILHLLTDFGIFIVSYTLYQHELLYFEQGAAFFAQQHTPLFSVLDLFLTPKISLFFSDFALAETLSMQIAVLWIYFWNFFAMFFLFLAPAYIWWILFKRRKAHEKKWFLVFSFIAITTYLLFPLFHLGKISVSAVSGIIGVDITTTAIAETPFASLPAAAVLLSGSVGLLVFLLSFWQWMRRELAYLSFIAALLFFGVYAFYYYTDILAYYANVVAQQYLLADYFVLFFMGIFMALSFLFYPVSYFLFLYELAKHYRLAKN